MATEQHIRLCARLYEMRDAARRLLGARYHERMAEYRVPIEQVQSQLECDPLTAATKFCVGSEARGIDVIYLMTAALEMIEPSEKGS